MFDGVRLQKCAAGATATASSDVPDSADGAGYYSILDAVKRTPSQSPPTYGYPRFGLMPQSAFDTDFKYADILLGYAHLFAGDFIEKTAARGQSAGFDTSLFFLQASYRW